MSDFLRPGLTLTVRERINRMKKEAVKALIRIAIARYPSGFDSAMLREPRMNMLDYLFDLDDSILMQLVK